MTRAEYLLTCLIEECAEVQHCATKVIRFGPLETAPGQSKNNYVRFIEEYADLTAVFELLADELKYLPAEFTDAQLDLMVKDKKAKVAQYMQYSKRLGTLDG